MTKRRKPTFLNILLIPDDDSPSRSLRIRYSLLKFLIAMGVIFLISVILGVITYSRVLQMAIERNALEEENKELRKQVARVVQIQHELEKLRAYNQRVRQTLEGYIHFQESSSPQEEIDLSEITMRQTSIFSDVPLLAPVVGFVSQEFKPQGHLGVDIAAPQGTPILAAADGVVLFSGWTYQDGYVVLLQHSRGFYTYYKHNLKNLVFNHQFVRQGEPIALLGSSGESSGPHLHFEIWKNGYPQNPEKYIDFKKTEVVQ